jgi:hypothetical protein
MRLSILIFLFVTVAAVFDTKAADSPPTKSFTCKKGFSVQARPAQQLSFGKAEYEGHPPGDGGRGGPPPVPPPECRSRHDPKHACRYAPTSDAHFAARKLCPVGDP